VGSEKLQLDCSVRHAQPGVPPLTSSKAHHSRRGAAFRGRLCATASVRSGVGDDRDACFRAAAADGASGGGYRKALEGIFDAPGAPGVVVYNAALPDPGEILDITVERLRTAHDVDVLGAVVAAQVAAPAMRAAGGGTLLAASGGFATIQRRRW